MNNNEKKNDTILSQKEIEDRKKFEKFKREYINTLDTEIQKQLELEYFESLSIVYHRKDREFIIKSESPLYRKEKEIPTSVKIKKYGGGAVTRNKLLWILKEIKNGTAYPLIQAMFLPIYLNPLKFLTNLIRWHPELKGKPEEELREYIAVVIDRYKKEGCDNIEEKVLEELAPGLPEDPFLPLEIIAWLQPENFEYFESIEKERDRKLAIYEQMKENIKMMERIAKNNEDWRAHLNKLKRDAEKQKEWLNKKKNSRRNLKRLQYKTIKLLIKLRTVHIIVNKKKQKGEYSKEYTSVIELNKLNKTFYSKKKKRIKGKERHKPGVFLTKENLEKKNNIKLRRIDEINAKRYQKKAKAWWKEKDRKIRLNELRKKRERAALQQKIIEDRKKGIWNEMPEEIEEIKPQAVYDIPCSIFTYLNASDSIRDQEDFYLYSPGVYKTVYTNPTIREKFPYIAEYYDNIKKQYNDAYKKNDIKISYEEHVNRGPARPQIAPIKDFKITRIKKGNNEIIRIKDITFLQRKAKRIEEIKEVEKDYERHKKEIKEDKKRWLAIRKENQERIRNSEKNPKIAIRLKYIENKLRELMSKEIEIKTEKIRKEQNETIASKNLEIKIEDPKYSHLQYENANEKEVRRFIRSVNDNVFHIWLIEFKAKIKIGKITDEIKKKWEQRIKEILIQEKERIKLMLIQQKEEEKSKLNEKNKLTTKIKIFIENSILKVNKENEKWIPLWLTELIKDPNDNFKDVKLNKKEKIQMTNKINEEINYLKYESEELKSIEIKEEIDKIVKKRDLIIKNLYLKLNSKEINKEIKQKKEEELKIFREKNDNLIRKTIIKIEKKWKKTLKERIKNKKEEIMKEELRNKKKIIEKRKEEKKLTTKIKKFINNFIEEKKWQVIKFNKTTTKNNIITNIEENNIIETKTEKNNDIIELENMLNDNTLEYIYISDEKMIKDFLNAFKRIGYSEEMLKNTEKKMRLNFKYYEESYINTLNLIDAMKYGGLDFVKEEEHLKWLEKVTEKWTTGWHKSNFNKWLEQLKNGKLTIEKEKLEKEYKNSKEFKEKVEKERENFIMYWKIWKKSYTGEELNEEEFIHIQNMENSIQMENIEDSSNTENTLTSLTLEDLKKLI